MAKAMSKSQIAATIAEKTGITKKQAVEALDTVAELAYKQAKHTFTVPGLGKQPAGDLDDLRTAGVTLQPTFWHV